MLGRSGMGCWCLFDTPKCGMIAQSGQLFFLIYRQSYIYIPLEICLRIYIYIIYVQIHHMYLCTYISSRIWKGHHHLAPNHVPILVSLRNAGQSALFFCCQSCKALRSNSEIDDNQKTAASQFSVGIVDGLKTPNSSFNRKTCWKNQTSPRFETFCGW